MVFCSNCTFFKNVFGGHMSFFGDTGTPVLDFWWHLLWVSKPEWVVPYLLFCGGECNEHSLRSTSGATCADLLVAGSAAGHFLTCISRGGTWLQSYLRADDGDGPLPLGVPQALDSARPLVERGQTRTQVGWVTGVSRHLSQTTWKQTQK